MRVTSLLCGPWADLRPFNGLYCKQYAADRCASVQSFVPYKAFRAGLSTHINSGVYSQKRCVVRDRLILQKRNFPQKHFPMKYRQSKRGNLSPPMVAAFTLYSFPTLKLYFKTSTTGETSESKQDEANRCKTKPSDVKYSAVLKISN